MSDTEFAINGEIYHWGPKVGASDFGMEPDVPELRAPWAEGPAPQWDIAIGEAGRTP